MSANFEMCQRSWRDSKSGRTFSLYGFNHCHLIWSPEPLKEWFLSTEAVVNTDHSWVCPQNKNMNHVKETRLEYLPSDRNNYVNFNNVIP